MFVGREGEHSVLEVVGVRGCDVDDVDAFRLLAQDPFEQLRGIDRILAYGRLFRSALRVR